MIERASYIRHQLDQIRMVKEKAAVYGTPDVASRIGMQSICNKEIELLNELREAEFLESKADAEIVLEGDPVEPGVIVARFFGEFLITLQSLVNSLAQHIANVKQSQGKFRQSFVKENRLLLLPTFPSSYGARFYLPDTAKDHAVLLDIEKDSPLELLNSMLDGASEPIALFDAISTGRVKGHYESLLKLLNNNGACLQYRSRGNSAGVKLSVKAARERTEWLALLRKDVDIQCIYGILVGGSLESNRFEIRQDDEVIRGSLTANTVNQMRGIKLGSAVRATLEVTTIAHEEDLLEPKVMHTLINIESSEEPQLQLGA